MGTHAYSKRKPGVICGRLRLTPDRQSELAARLNR
jgi:hypothetical protein